MKRYFIRIEFLLIYFTKTKKKNRQKSSYLARFGVAMLAFVSHDKKAFVL